MNSIAIFEAMAFKRELETDFLHATGLTSRRQASAVYSLPQQCPLLWLNLNPGGDEATCILLSDNEIAQGKHEFFDGHGVTSAETAACLNALFPNDAVRVRSVQGSNVIWERSTDAGGIDLRRAASETAPLLRRFIRFVGPEVIIFGGITAWEVFCRANDAQVSGYGGEVMGPYRGRTVRLFVRAELDIPEVGKVRSAAILHPSKRRWSEVLEPLRETTANISLPKPIAVTVVDSEAEA